MVFLKRNLIIVLALIMLVFVREVSANTDVLLEFSNLQTKSSIVINYDSIEYNNEFQNGKYDIDSIDIRFGAIISKSMYESLKEIDKNVRIGIGAAKTTKMEQDGKQLIDYAHTSTFFTCNPKKADVNGYYNNEGEYYLISITITDVSLKQKDSSITAGCFIYINNETYIMKEVNYSVESICKYYLDNCENQVRDHSGLLEYIYNL